MNRMTKFSMLALTYCITGAAMGAALGWLIIRIVAVYG